MVGGGHRHARKSGTGDRDIVAFWNHLFLIRHPSISSDIQSDVGFRKRIERWTDFSSFSRLLRSGVQILRVSGLKQLPVWYEAGAAKYEVGDAVTLFFIQMLLFL